MENVPFGERSVWRTFRLENVPFGERSVWRTFRLENVPFGERSVWRTFRLQNVPFGERSVWRTFRLENVPFAERSVWRTFRLENVPFGECSVWKTFRLVNVAPFPFLVPLAVADIALACGSDKSLEVFDLNVGCSVRTLPDVHTRVVHTIAQNKVNATAEQPNSPRCRLISRVSPTSDAPALRMVRHSSRLSGIGNIIPDNVTKKMYHRAKDAIFRYSVFD